MSDQQFNRMQNMLAGWRDYMNDLVEDDPEFAALQDPDHRLMRDAVREAYTASFEATGPHQTIEPSEDWIRAFITERVIPLILEGAPESRSEEP